MTAARLRILVAALAIALPIARQAPRASAAAALTVTPVTWNVVGLDSNNPAVAGPNLYPVGARLCNTGDTTLTNLVATFVWDSSNSFVDLASDSAVNLSVAAPTPGACTNVYYTVALVRSKAAIDTARRYHITVTADGGVSGSTPTPREIYVQGLNSQSRNSVTSISGPQTVAVGQTAQYVVTSKTSATFDQLSDYLNFPNTLFKVVSIAATYEKPAGATNDKEYADACGWQNDPTQPSYLGCVGPALYPGGVGGTIVTTYTVQLVANGSATLTDVIVDSSGKSYHYNGDYGQGINSVPVTIEPLPTSTPTDVPSSTPTTVPSSTPTTVPSSTPTTTSVPPTVTNTPVPPTATQTDMPTTSPSSTPTDVPTSTPTTVPSSTPTDAAANMPVPQTDTATATPTDVPPPTPTTVPSSTPTELPAATVAAPLMLPGMLLSTRASAVTATTPTPVATSTALTPPVSPTHTSSHSTPAVAPTRTVLPTATAPARPHQGTGTQRAASTPTPLTGTDSAVRTATPRPMATTTPAPSPHKGVVTRRPVPTMTAPSSARPVVRTATPQPTSTAAATSTPRPLRGTTGAPSAPPPAGTPQGGSVPVVLPQMPDTGYGPPAAAHDTQGNSILLGGVLVALLALVGGWGGSLRRRSRPL